MGDQTEAPWTASVTRVDPQAHVYLGNLHQDDRITPYTRDTRGRWSRATTSGEPADSRLNALFEWLVEEANVGAPSSCTAAILSKARNSSTPTRRQRASVSVFDSCRGAL
jgi:hypothetical protein